MAVYPKAFTDDDFTQLSDGRYLNTFSDVPLKKIIGIKLN